MLHHIIIYSMFIFILRRSLEVGVCYCLLIPKCSFSRTVAISQDGISEERPREWEQLRCILLKAHNIVILVKISILSTIEI